MKPQILTGQGTIEGLLVLGVMMLLWLLVLLIILGLLDSKEEEEIPT
jgi:hypothetical protein